MIISRKHRYLFIEIPLTGSWAIRHELCKYYDGVPILHKHATYPEFRKIAAAEAADFTVFATVRNPLDTIVSRYFKLRTNHKGAFSDPRSTAQLLTDYSDHKKYKFVKESHASFQQYFRRYYRQPYSNMIDVSSNIYSFVIHYERLQEDFSEVLRSIGLEQVRPIPVVNPTQGRDADWASYYTADVVEQAKRIAGPFMKKWGYRFPPEWGEPHASWFSQMEFLSLCILRQIYLTHFRYNRGALASIVRKTRAWLVR